MNSKQSFALAALAASLITSTNASAQYETRGTSIRMKEEILNAYQNNDLVKIDKMKTQISELNQEILHLEMQKYGSSFANSSQQKLNPIK